MPIAFSSGGGAELEPSLQLQENCCTSANPHGLGTNVQNLKQMISLPLKKMLTKPCVMFFSPSRGFKRYFAR